MRYCSRIVMFLKSIGIILLFSGCCFFGNCDKSPQMPNDNDLQQQAIDEKLEGVKLGELQYACDGCNFYMQEAITNKNASMNKGNVGGVRSQTGIRVYIFHDVPIDRAFYMLLDSNIFASNMDRDMKNALMQTILAKQNDFSQQNSIDKIGLYAFSSLSYAKRLNSDAKSPRAMLDSVEIVQRQDESLHSTNSLEGFIVGGKIVILHFYGESNSWTRR